AVIAAPMRGAENVAPGVAGDFVGQGEWCRLRMKRVAEPGENRTVPLETRIESDALPTFERRSVRCRYADDSAVAGNFNSVIAARHPIAEIPSKRQPRSAMRAPVLERVHLARLFAPDDHPIAQARETDGRLMNVITRGDRIPVVAQAQLDQSLDRRALRARVERHRRPPIKALSRGHPDRPSGRRAVASQCESFLRSTPRRRRVG